MDFKPYKDDNWSIDSSNITIYYTQGAWSIASGQIEYLEERAVLNGSGISYEIVIKAIGRDKPYEIGTFESQASEIKDTLAAFAAYNGLEYRIPKAGAAAEKSGNGETAGLTVNPAAAPVKVNMFSKVLKMLRIAE